MRISFFQGALAIGLSLCLSQNVNAEDFYRGKTLSIVVGATPGGAFDIISRALSRSIGQHIPGKPNVVVQNMPGAGSMTALGYIDSVAPVDGTVFGTFLPGIITQSILTPEKIRANMGNVAWIGVVSADYSRVCYGFGPNGIKSMAKKSLWFMYSWSIN